MCSLCGNPVYMHEAAETGGTGTGPQSSAANGLADLTETTDAAAGTSTAYTLQIGQIAQGALSANGDHDWYKVNLVSGQTYTFALVGTGASGCATRTLRIYGTDSATIVAQDDDSLPNQNSIITYTATTSGTFYIDAGAFNNAGSGQYGVSVAAE